MFRGVHLEVSETQSVRLSGDLDPNTLHKVAAIVAKDLGEDVSVEVVQNEDFFTFGSYATDISAIAALLVETIRAILNAWHSLRARSWDEHRLLEVVRAALAERDVTNYQFTDIKNLGSLRGQGAGPCTIVVQSSSGTFQINVFLDGTVFTFSLASAVSKPDEAADLAEGQLQRDDSKSG